ncbi:MAG: uracil-DNA glycosylase [Gemmatimonadota bacterium]
MNDALRRYLAQQVELGGSELFLERHVAGDARARLAEWTPALPVQTEAPDSRGGADAAAGPALPTGYEALREEALHCTRCRLAESRTHVVFSDGNPQGRLVVVGEAPGANEDATGLPFVGAAGQLLDLLLAAIDLSRQDSVYICNVLKCRPPGNRNPLPDEIEACSPFLLRQLELVRPQALLAVGTFAAQLLTGTSNPIGRLRGSVHTYHGTPLVVTYHPAALLRNQSWTRATWDDLQLLRQVMDRSS